MPRMRAPYSLAVMALVTTMWSACESTVKESKSVPPTIPGSAPDPVAEPVAEPAASPPAASGLIDVASAEMYVARLVRNEPLSFMAPSEYCLDDGHLWKGSRFRLGRVNVFGLDEELAKLRGLGPFAIIGTKKLGLDSKLQDAGPCPQNYEPLHVQMRSDWIAPEGGPLTTRKRLGELPYIEARAVHEVKIAEFLESDKDSVRVRIRNPFTEDFSSLTFEAHYEGGPGKPMPTMVEQVLALEPGQSTELTLPRELEDAPRTKSGSGLHSLELKGQLDKAELDIEIFVPHQ